MTVMTVTGPVPATELGTTMAHEHVLFDLSTYYTAAEDAPDGVEQIATDTLWWLRNHPMNSRANLSQQDLESAVAELAPLIAAGGRTIVDQTVSGIGPRPAELVEISTRTGIQIVAGLGFYIAGSYSDEVANWSQSQLADHLRRELTEGIEGSGVRPGMIGELGISSPVLPFEQRLLAAAAQLQAEFDLAVSIHTPWGVDGVRGVADAAERAGLNPARTALCHLENRFDTDHGLYHEIAKRGFVLSLDCFGRDCYYPHVGVQLPSDETRIRVMLDLFAAGYGDQVLASQDICYQHELVANGGHGYAHILRSIAPRLRAGGFTDADFTQLLVGNPRAWLAGS